MGRKFRRTENYHVLHQGLNFKIILKNCKGDLPITLRVSLIGECTHIDYNYLTIYYGTKGDEVIKKIQKGKRHLPKWLYNIAEKINNHV